MGQAVHTKNTYLSPEEQVAKLTEGEENNAENDREAGQILNHLVTLYYVQSCTYLKIVHISFSLAHLHVNSF